MGYQATRFTERSTHFGPSGPRRSNAKLVASFVCADCERPLALKWSAELQAQGEAGPSPSGWAVACTACGSWRYVSLATLRRERAQGDIARGGSVPWPWLATLDQEEEASET